VAKSLRVWLAELTTIADLELSLLLDRCPSSSPPIIVPNSHLAVSQRMARVKK
jgi:hypothetical protein